MEYHRSPKQTMAGLAMLLVMAVLAAVCLDYAWNRDSVLAWAAGVFFLAWAVFVAWSLVHRRVFVRLERHGCWINTALGRVQFDFDDLLWANLEHGQRICFFAYQTPDDDKPRYAGISQKSLGPEAVEIIRKHVYRARPDLPKSDPNAPTKNETGA